jgi:hypothetical protein
MKRMSLRLSKQEDHPLVTPCFDFSICPLKGEIATVRLLGLNSLVIVLDGYAT